MSAEPIISLKTRNEFREYFVGGTLREIRETFDGAGVRCDLEYSPPVSGERRGLVEQYYRTVNWSDWVSVKSVVKAFETEIRELYAPGTPVFAWSSAEQDQHREHRKKIADKLLYWLQQDGFLWSKGRLVRAMGAHSLQEIAAVAHHLDSAYLSQQIERMKDAVESDPALAIGTAKELLETVCKTILEERGKPVQGQPDMPTLTKAVLKELRLVPEQVNDAAKGADLIRAILRSLGTIGNDMAQLRGLYGTGHGKAANTRGLKPRHAKLAVGAVTTMVTFLFETNKEISPPSG